MTRQAQRVASLRLQPGDAELGRGRAFSRDGTVPAPPLLDRPEQVVRVFVLVAGRLVVSLTPVVGGHPLVHFLTRPPLLASEDEEQLLAWCVGIVALARKNGYLASTADSIAVYHTSMLLAQLRNRRHPTPYDFRDAAITCLEKDFTPKKRNTRR